MPNAVFNWSGGKDSSLALHKVLKEGKYDIVSLLTSLHERHKRISMHGVREELLELQAKSIGIPLHKLWLPETLSMTDYNSIMKETMSVLRGRGISYSIFGDIYLEDLKAYREKQSEKAGMKAVFPLWKQSTNKLVKEFIDVGFKAVVVCVDAKCLDKSFAGRIIDENFLKDLPENVDPCGENGEYHSFVFNGPIFKKPVSFKGGETVYREFKGNGEDVPYNTGFYYFDLLPDILEEEGT